MRGCLGIPRAIVFSLRLLLPPSPAGLSFKPCCPLPRCYLSTHHWSPGYWQILRPGLQPHNTKHMMRPDGWCSYSPCIALIYNSEAPSHLQPLQPPSMHRPRAVSLHMPPNFTATLVGSFLQECPCTRFALQTKDEGTTICLPATRH